MRSDEPVKAVDTNSYGHARIRHEVYDMLELHMIDGFAFAVYVAIAHHADGLSKKIKIAPTTYRLGAAIGVKRQTVAAKIEQLRRIGLIAIASRHAGVASSYLLLEPRFPHDLLRDILQIPNHNLPNNPNGWAALVHQEGYNAVIDHMEGLAAALPTGSPRGTGQSANQGAARVRRATGSPRGTGRHYTQGQLRFLGPTGTSGDTCEGAESGGERVESPPSAPRATGQIAKPSPARGGDSTGSPEATGIPGGTGQAANPNAARADGPTGTSRGPGPLGDPLQEEIKNKDNPSDAAPNGAPPNHLQKSPVGRITEAYGRLFELRYQTTPLIAFDKMGAHIKRILRLLANEAPGGVDPDKYAEDILHTLLKKFFALGDGPTREDRYATETGHSFATFVTMVNQLRVAARPRSSAPTTTSSADDEAVKRFNERFRKGQSA